MKKIIALTISAVSLASLSHAWIESSQNGARYGSPTIEQCSENLYINLSTYSSSTDTACSYGRTDAAFQTCTLNMTKRLGDDNKVPFAGFLCASGVGATEYRTQDCVLAMMNFFGHQVRDYSLSSCRRAANPDFAGCAINLYRNGGLEVENNSLPMDAFRLCHAVTNVSLNRCIVENHRAKGMNGLQAAQSCLEIYDPVLRAKKEAQKRAEEQRRMVEQQRLAEQRRIEEQRRFEQKQIEEARNRERVEAKRRLEEQRILEEKLRRQEDLRAEELRRQQELRQAEEKNRAEEQKRQQTKQSEQEKRLEQEQKAKQEEARKLDEQRKQDEKRKLEEQQRKQLEQLKQQEQQKQMELQKQKQQQEQQQKQKDSQKKDEQNKQNQSSDSGGSSDEDDDDGVIVDLPNFD